MNRPSVGEVAAAQATNISGGVNPSASLPSAPQPSRLEGPLEPPFGRTFSQPCTLQRAYANTKIYQSKSPVGRAIAFWNVYCDTLAGRGLLGLQPEQDRARREGGKEYHLYLQHHGPIRYYFQITAQSISR